MTISIHFLPDDIITEAEPGEPILEVAGRAGVFIPTGCVMGHCHACEVELGDGTMLCACISAIPADVDSLTINLYSEPLW